jgi:hypothetical protein
MEFQNLNEDSSMLKEKLDIINRYDKVGLKELFRKSGSKLEYQFKKINDLYSYYTLTVKVEDRTD